MKVANSFQMKNIDSITINEYGIPSIVLMENAGRAVANEILNDNTLKNIVIFCGKGNNGGDGCVVARHLFNNGLNVSLVLIANEQELKGDAKINFEAVKAIGVKILYNTKDAMSSLNNADIIVDALLGIGVNGELKGDILHAVKLINSVNKRVISIDMPTGISADTGEVFGECIKANKTITFGLTKVGLVCYPAKAYAGEVIVKDISFASGAIESQNININLIEKISMPKRPIDGYKGSFGKAFVLAGSIGFTGAAYLSSTAAMRSGCGVVTLGIPSSLNAIMEQKLTEVMTVPLHENNGVLSRNAMPLIRENSENSNCILCGCGLSVNDDIREIVKGLITSNKKPVVLDADAINSLKGNTDILKRKSCEVVLTPHIGEMVRLTGYSINDIQNNTVQVAQSFAVEYNVVVVLKSAHTVVASPNGDLYINNFGNSGMATAGSGDVLAGIITSLITQGLSPCDACVSGVYIHARSGDLAAARLGKRALMACDILDNISNLELLLYV